MFMKLLKHEWRSTRGILGLLCVIILTSGVAIGGSGFYMAYTADRRFAGDDSILMALTSILVVAAIVAIAVCCAGGIFYFIWRFYQSRFTDEGYLTFTLPITTHQNLLSSLVNTLWGCVLILMAAAAAMMVAFLLLLMAYNSQIVWADVWVVMPELWSSFLSMWSNSWRNLLWFAGVMLSTGISQVILLMLAVTIGSIIAKKHKILTAVGAYWLISLVRNTVHAIGLVTSESGKWLIQYPLYTGIVIIAVGYFLMYFLLEKKLNLN